MASYQQLDDWLVANRLDYHRLLQPPATHSELAAAATVYCCTLPEEFAELYRWHNGQQSGNFTVLLLNLTIMTLRESMATHTMLTDMAPSEGWPSEHWQPAWLPFLDNGGGDHLCYVVRDGHGFTRGQVIWFDQEGGEPHEVIHESLLDFRRDLYDRMLNDRLELTG
ncbi:SMI1/KNR4 family protein [Rhodopirellula baltica]